MQAEYGSDSGEKETEGGATLQHIHRERLAGLAAQCSVEG